MYLSEQIIELQDNFFTRKVVSFENNDSRPELTKQSLFKSKAIEISILTGFS